MLLDLMIYSHGPDQPPIQTKQKLKNQRLFPSSLPSPTNGRILETVLQKMVNFSEFCCQLTRKCVVSDFFSTFYLT